MYVIFVYDCFLFFSYNCLADIHSISSFSYKRNGRESNGKCTKIKKAFILKDVLSFVVFLTLFFSLLGRRRSSCTIAQIR